MVGMVASMMQPAEAEYGAEGEVAGQAGPDENLHSLLADMPDAMDAVAPPPTRLELLTAAIERHPDAPVNYVLRGEALREAGNLDSAVDDFLTALRLAEGRETTWEFLNRAFLDRARQGLRRCGYTSAE